MVDAQGAKLGFVDRWQTVGTPSPSELAEARAVVRYAARIVAQHGRARASAPHEGGELEWLEDHQVLAGPLGGAESATRAALRVAELTLLLLDAEGNILKTYPLDGATAEDALAWLRNETVVREGEGTVPIAPPDAPPEPWPGGLGDALALRQRASFAELERWYSNADHVLRNVARVTAGASRVCCAASTLEIGTTLDLPAREGEAPRSVSIGMSPGGDARSAAPRFFVRPAPVEQVRELPAVTPPARWERDEPVAIVVRSEDIVAVPDGDAQAARVQTFLDSAVPAAHQLLQRHWRPKGS